MSLALLLIRNTFLTFALMLPLGVQASALSAFLERLSELQSLEANFIQSTIDGAGNTLQVIKGTLAVEKPGKMRWETLPPFEQLVVSDGLLVWIYDMDLEQVTIRKMEQRFQETPALLLSGNVNEIGRNFIVTQQVNGVRTTYELAPKDQSQLFERLEFQYNKNQLAAMSIYDAVGQVTKIDFNNVRVNKALDSKTFHFDVPEGVDVIDGRHGR